MVISAVLQLFVASGLTREKAGVGGSAYLQLAQPVLTLGRLLRPRFAGCPSSDFPEASLTALSVFALET